MATQLSNATKNAKRYLIIFGIIVVIIIIISWITSSVKPKIPTGTTTTVAGYPNADNLFKTIPKPELTSIKIAEGSPALVAKTGGTFPEMPATAYVYLIKPEREYAGDASSARTIATNFNFSKDETKVINNVMYWETPDKNRTLQYDKAQRLWNYRYATYPTTSSTKLLTKADEYLKVSYSFFNSVGLSSELISGNAGRAEFIQIDTNGNYTNSSETFNAVKTSLFKKLLIITPTDSKITSPYAEVRKFKYTEGIVNMLLNGEGKTIKDNLLQLNYKNFSYGDKGIYEILKPEEAFVMLQGGSGYLYRLVLNNENEYSTDLVSEKISQYRLDTTKTRIIYIEPENVNANIAWTNYLQPYYLFEGTFTTTTEQSGLCAFIIPAIRGSN